MQQIHHTGMIRKALLHFPQSLMQRRISRNADTTPQSTLQTEAFMGRWYEQARFENVFESGLEHVYCDYALLAPNRFRVYNCGFDASGRLHCAKGVARIPHAEAPAKLRVSFIPPYFWFSSPLHVLYTDANYSEALISGSGDHYLWLLTRDRKPSRAAMARLISESVRRKFDITQLHYTQQH